MRPGEPSDAHLAVFVVVVLIIGAIISSATPAPHVSTTAERTVKPWILRQ